MKKSYVYILECADGTLYTGWTTSPERRLQFHNEGKASKYTRGRLPVKFVFLHLCEDESTARRLEIAIKRLTKKKKLDLIRTGQLPSLTHR